MSRIIRLDCSNGISGDMIVGALINLGVNQDFLIQELSTLPVEGYKIIISQIEKAGVTACDFLVQLEAEYENHDHDMEYLYGHKKAGCEELLADLKQISTHHSHRNLKDIISIIHQSQISERAKEYATKIFTVLATAEASVHGTTIEQVHFHEVGAVDSIVDIVAIAICMEQLDVNEIIIDSLYDGTGTVRCQHGIIPIPAPAVREIARKYQIPIRILDIEGEYVTPTGAAAIAAFGKVSDLPKDYRKLATGIGAGKRKTDLKGILEATLIEINE